MAKFAKGQQSGLSFSLQPVSSILGPVFKLIKLGWGNLGYVFSSFIFQPKGNLAEAIVQPRRGINLNLA